MTNSVTGQTVACICVLYVKNGVNKTEITYVRYATAYFHGAAVQVTISSSACAVSYTHLDVYKRQGLTIHGHGNCYSRENDKTNLNFVNEGVSVSTPHYMTRHQENYSGAELINLNKYK